MTGEALRALSEAECVIGAGRMLEAVCRPGQARYEAVAPEKIAAYIHDHREFCRYAVAMSGDTGFSAAQRSSCPSSRTAGWRSFLVSAPSAFCAPRLGTSYEDVVCVRSPRPGPGHRRRRGGSPPGLRPGGGSGRRIRPLPPAGGGGAGGRYSQRGRAAGATPMRQSPPAPPGRWRKNPSTLSARCSSRTRRKSPRGDPRLPRRNLPAGGRRSGGTHDHERGPCGGPLQAPAHR